MRFLSRLPYGILHFPPGETRFQLHRPFIGMVGVDVTHGKAPNIPSFDLISSLIKAGVIVEW